MNQRFEEIEHTADIALRVRGPDLPALFANAARGMACQLAEPCDAPPTTEREIELDAYDAETLLVAWLGELLYLGERDDCVFTEFEMLEVTPHRLRAAVRGGPVAQHRRHIKAVTFSDLDITCTEDGLETTVVFDV
jgi:SHS2 domain-containing protein